MDVSQLRYPEIMYSCPKHEFFVFLCSKVSDSLNHYQTSYWVYQSRIDASQLQYLEIVHSGPKTSIASFYLPKVSEML
jgi:hypothetical protein